MREMASLVVDGRAGSAGVDAGRRGCSLEVDAVADDANLAYGRVADVRLDPARVLDMVPRRREDAEKMVSGRRERSHAELTRLPHAFC